MKLFLKYIGEHLRLYPQVKLSKNDQILIQNAVMSHLGLTNLNQLRDRYEGQAFLDKTTKNIGGSMAVRKHLNIEPLDLNITKLNDFQPSIQLNGQKVLVNVFKFGELPLVSVNEMKYPTLFILQKDTLTFLICGLASKKVIKNSLIESTMVKSRTDKFMEFTGFDFLEKFN